MRSSVSLPARLLPVFAAAVGAAAIVVACPQPTPLPGTLQILVSPKRLTADGTTTDISVVATEADGTPGSGDVVLRVARGVIDGKPDETVVALANGRASVKYACNASLDAACVGSQRVSGDWKGNAATATVDFTAPGADGGADAGADGGSDGGVRPDGGSPTAFVALSATRSRVFLSVGDFSDITAVLSARPDGGGAMVGQPLTFTTNLGGFTPGDGGTPATPFTATTEANGTAVARFHETGTVGTAAIVATHAATGASGQVNVEVVNVQQISWISTTCTGTACTIMGIKGSGFNEQAQVTFRVVDANGRPAVGVNVAFSIANPPSGTTWLPNGLTDAQGYATTNVSAGPVIGSFAVHAVAVPGRVETDSPTIGIRGAKASNHGLALKCQPVNNGVYVSPTPPASYQLSCVVKVVDRYNNPVGTGTSVNFKVEAGSIPSSIATKKYDPTGSNADEGTGTVTFSSLGGTPFAVDVPPLPAASGQWPYTRDAEPSVTAGALTLNPRDGLVTVIAYLQGEEFFNDNNSNGIHDPAESFIDQGEPFIDANDNGTWDANEIFIDVNSSLSWDGPNGQWDGATTIWSETRVLYTGRPDPSSANSHVVPSPFATACSCIADGGCTGGVPRGTTVRLDTWFGDARLNRVQAAGTTFSVKHTATKGMVSWAASALQDGYGFDIERRLVNAATEGDCLGAAICKWKVLFGKWGRGYVGQAEVAGATPSDTTACQNDVVTVKGTVLSYESSIDVSGAIQ